MREAPRRRALGATLLGVIVMASGGFALIGFLVLPRLFDAGVKAEERSPKAAPAPPAAPARVQVHALARLEPEAGLIKVGARPGVRIERLLVKEGDEVSPGAELALLEGRPQAELQVTLAENQKKAADLERTLAHERLGIEREREDGLRKERLDTQQKAVELADRRFKAAGEIYKTLGQAAQGKVKYDLDLAYFQAEGELLKARLELKELQVAQDLIDKRRHYENRQVDAQQPDENILKTQIEMARAGRDQTMVLAPAAGRVLEVLAHAGEVSIGPLLSLGDLTSMVAIAEVYQSDVPELKPGDPAEVLIQGRAVAGKVLRISRLVGRNTLASLDPRALQDRRVVEVTVQLDDPQAAADYVNMEVEVTIRPQPGKPR